MASDYYNYLQRFEKRELGPEHFDHTGHLLMAWVHLSHYQADEATRRVCDGVRDLASAFGAPEKYSHTLTIAFMRIINQRMQGQPAGEFESFLDANPDLVRDAQSLLLRHYSRERLNSEEARQRWVEPDLEPFHETG